MEQKNLENIQKELELGSKIYNKNLYRVSITQNNYGSSKEERIYVAIANCLAENGVSSLGRVVTYYVNRYIEEFKEDEKIPIRIIKEELLENPKKYNVCFYLNKHIDHLTSEKRIIYMVKYIKEHERIISFDMPMIHQPYNWINSKTFHNAVKGGYYSNMYFNLRKLVKKGDENYVQMKINKSYLEIINKIQQQPFSSTLINDCLLKYQEIINDKNNEIKNTTSNINFLSKMDTLELKEKYKILIRNKEVEEAQLEVYKSVYEKYKEFADLIKRHNIKNIYFTVACDFRGRIYIPGALTPTNDKILRKFLKDENGNNMYEYDARASILQILSIFTFNTKLMEILGLYEDKYKVYKNNIKDPWSSIFDKLINNDFDKNYINELLNIYDYTTKNYNKRETPSVDKIYNIMKDNENEGYINRELCKYTIMRILYGSNPYTISKEYRKKLGYRIKYRSLSYRHIHVILGKFIKEFPLEYKLMMILPKINGASLKKNNVGVTVNTGNLSFSNTYSTVEKRRIGFMNKDTSKISKVEWSLYTDKINIRKSNISFRANLFHAVDSSICTYVIDNMIIDDSIVTVHDAFIIKENSYSKLKEIYKHALIKSMEILPTLLNENIDIAINIKGFDKIYDEINENKTIFYRDKINYFFARYALKRET